MYKICYFVPESHLDETRNALFGAGAGHIGDYDQCAWHTSGQGQFRPLSGSQPFIGETGVLQTVAEYKVELVCLEGCVKSAIAALKAAHPYQEPAYEVFALMQF